MAQITTTLYEKVAHKYHQAVSSTENMSSYINEALLEVIDITSSNYPSEGSPDASEAAKIELLLLGSIDSTKEGVDTISTDYSFYLETARNINNYVINNFNFDDGSATISAGSTSAEKLTDYVNNICEWTEENPSGVDEVPYYWAAISNAAGFDVSNWHVQPNPVTGEQTLGISNV